jgi:hypothetical protein
MKERESEREKQERGHGTALLRISYPRPNDTTQQWLGVAIYNPLLVLLALFCFPLDVITEKQNSIVAHMAETVRACVRASEGGREGVMASIPIFHMHIHIEMRARARDA